jgi:hypothetical protein
MMIPIQYASSATDICDAKLDISLSERLVQVHVFESVRLAAKARPCHAGLLVVMAIVTR